MWLLYKFKLELFDRDSSYPFSTDFVLIAQSHERRCQLIRDLVERDRSYSLQRCVLLAVRPLALREQHHFREEDQKLQPDCLLWLAARPAVTPALHPTLYVYTTDELEAITARSKVLLDIFLLTREQRSSSLTLPCLKRAA